MKLSTKFFMTVFMVIIAITQSFAENYDFRKTKWGMSKDQVKSSEPLKVAKETDDMLLYKTTVIGKNVLLVYIFVNNQLVRSKYILAEFHTNNNDFITDFNEFKKILVKKYGTPIKDEKIWRNDLYKDDFSNWGMAIALGHLLYFAQWETSNTTITAILKGDNFDITCGIEYASKKLEDLEKKAQEKKALEAF